MKIEKLILIEVIIQLYNDTQDEQKLFFLLKKIL